METDGTTEWRRTDKRTHSRDTKDSKNTEEDSDYIGNVTEYVTRDMKETENRQDKVLQQVMDQIARI